MKDLKNRQDIFLLVSNFYTEIRKDELLGPIFNSHITQSQWSKHLEKLTDFWVTALFGTVCFKGNPVQSHKNVDRNLNYTINQTHFDKWLQLWFKTIDSLYKGKIAQRAKDASIRMATSQYQIIFNSRPTF